MPWPYVETIQPKANNLRTSFIVGISNLHKDRLDFMESDLSNILQILFTHKDLYVPPRTHEQISFVGKPNLEALKWRVVFLYSADAYVFRLEAPHQDGPRALRFFGHQDCITVCGSQEFYIGFKACANYFTVLRQGKPLNFELLSYQKGWDFM